jgi:predicted small lipoprotein YifL
LYGAARIGDFDVKRDDRATCRRWALILVATSALALSGCGRKGPLDLPPSASAEQRANAVQPDPTSPQQANQPNLFNPNSAAEAPPTAGRGPKRPFALDPLLNSN